MSLVEIRGNPKVVYTRFQRLIKPIGRRSKIVRHLYWKFSGGSYLWGIVGYIRDYGQRDTYKEAYTYNDAGAEWLEEMLEKIFAFEEDKDDNERV